MDQMIQSKQLFSTTVLRKATKHPHEKPSKVLIKSLDMVSLVVN